MLPLRFWTKVDKKGPDACWPWTGAKDTMGYGLLRVSRKSLRAHRLLLEETLGRPLGLDMCALHRCDTRACVNPAHLWEGTQAENNQDRHRKGRTVLPVERARGVGVGTSKLTPDQIGVIRVATGSARAIAAQFGVTHTTVL